MAQLVVRGLDDRVKGLLRRRAADHGRSMEAEVRAILTDAVAPRRKSIAAALREVALEYGGVDELPVPSRDERQRSIDFEA